MTLGFDFCHGPTKRSSICSANLSAESNLSNSCKAWAYDLDFRASWYARVGIIRICRLVSSNWREQKKVPAKTVRRPVCSFFSSLWKYWAMVYAIVVLPEPAWPVSQKTGGLSAEMALAHAIISFRISSRVPSVHGSRVTVALAPKSAL